MLLDLPQDVGHYLRSQCWTIATAESCTGGLIGHLLTEIAGSSDYYIGGMVAYSNAVKHVYLGVPEAILQFEGAVSEATARAMAEGVRRAMGSDIGLAVTGIAGPGGATPAKPVGLVYIAISTPQTTFCRRYQFGGDRSAVKQQSALAALRMVLDLQTMH